MGAVARAFVTLACAATLIGACKKKGAEPCPPLVEVSVPYPGASPSEVEAGILLAVEEQLRGVDGIESVDSVAYEGIGIAVVAVKKHDLATLKTIREELDRITSLPQEAERPQVVEVPAGGSMQLVVVTADVAMGTLVEIADRIRDDLLQSEGIARVWSVGDPSPEMVIEVVPARLRAMGISLAAVRDALSKAMFDVGGPDGAKPFVMSRGRVDGVLPRLMETEVARADGRSIRLHDIASISTSLSPQRAFFRQRPAIALLVQTDAKKPIGVPTSALPPSVEATTLGPFELRRCGIARWRSSDDVAIARVHQTGGASLAAQWEDRSETPVLALGGLSLLPGGPTSKDDTELVAFGEDIGPALLRSLPAGPNASASLLAPPHRVRIELTGIDHAELSRSAAFVTTHLGQHAKALGITRFPAPTGEPRIDVTLSKRARTLGLSESAVASTVRAALVGETVAMLQQGRRALPVRLQFGPARDLSELTSLEVPLPDGTTVPLGQVVEISIAGGTDAIYRRNAKRAITIEVGAASKADRRALVAMFKDELRASLAPSVTATID